jgi:hypothetical protein
MRAILIDPTIEGGLVTEGDFDIDRSDVRSLYKILGVDNIERAGPLLNGDMVYVDGNGLIKADPGPFFVIEGWDDPLAGRGLLLHDTRAGYMTSPRTSLRKAKAMVTFPDIELAGFEDFTDVVRGATIIGVHAVFRKRG